MKTSVFINDMNWDKMKNDVFYGRIPTNPYVNVVSGNPIWHKLVEEEFKEFNTKNNEVVNIPYLKRLPKCIFQIILEDFCSGKEFVNLSMVSKEFKKVIYQNKNYVDYTWKYYCFIFFE
jgi:hypothetical protein